MRTGALHHAPVHIEEDPQHPGNHEHKQRYGEQEKIELLAPLWTEIDMQEVANVNHDLDHPENADRPEQANRRQCPGVHKIERRYGQDSREEEAGDVTAPPLAIGGIA